MPHCTHSTNWAMEVGCYYFNNYPRELTWKEFDLLGMETLQRWDTYGGVGSDPEGLVLGNWSRQMHPHVLAVPSRGPRWSTYNGHDSCHAQLRLCYFTCHSTTCIFHPQWIHNQAYAGICGRSHNYWSSTSIKGRHNNEKWASCAHYSDDMTRYRIFCR